MPGAPRGPTSRDLPPASGKGLPPPPVATGAASTSPSANLGAKSAAKVSTRFEKLKSF